MVTMTDVAKHAKVSIMTVSRVINKSGYVKAETRKAVEKAIQELKFHPNLVAKSLVTGKSNIIAYVLSDICDQFYGSVCKGVEKACNSRGYIAIICNEDEDNGVDKYIDMIIDRNLDGAIFHHLSINEQQIQKLADHHIKCVTIDNEILLEGVSSVDSDDYNGAKKAVEYLAKNGYQKIGCLLGETDKLKPEELSYLERFQHRIWKNRTLGYIDGMKECGLVPAGYYAGRGSAPMDIGFECGRKIAQEILADSDLPDALYCESDVLALGVLSELLERRLDIPQHIALVGHDGLDMCRILYPRVTTVAQPQYELGICGANMLLDAIQGQEKIEHIILESNLFVGNTTSTK